MNLFTIEALDLFFRCAAVGQLLLLCGLYLHLPFTGQQLSLLAVAVGAAAYLLLTAPIPNDDYGLLRNLLLTLTDAWPFTIWLTARYYFEDDFAPSRWPLPVKAGVGLYLLWHGYFFGVQEGHGVFHDISHLVAIALLVHVIYLALTGRNDDLVNSRRKSRVPVAIWVSAYGILLALVELAPHQVRHSELFNLLNALFVFLSVLILARYIFGRHVSGGTAPQVQAGRAQKELEDQSFVPPALGGLKEKLDEFMQSGGYRQSGLSIADLARQLSCPEHHLRRLINTALGFRNFNAFLNSWRIRDAREQLADPALTQTPILTIALNLGYGSVGPFNRAFKAEMGKTPSEYRRSFKIGASFS